MAKFAEEYVLNGYNGGGAYKVAYGQEDSQICASEAYKLLRDERIQKEIERVEGSYRILGHMSGLDKRTVVKILAEMASATKIEKNGKEVPDHTARKDAITLWAKLLGDFKERKEIDLKDEREKSEIDPTKMTEQERRDLEKELLDEL